MSNVTMRTIGVGGAITTADLFLTRQGADTVDKSVTGTLLRAFIVASGPFITQLGTVTAGTVDGGTP